MKKLLVLVAIVATLATAGIAGAQGTGTSDVSATVSTAATLDDDGGTFGCNVTAPPAVTFGDFAALSNEKLDSCTVSVTATNSWAVSANDTDEGGVETACSGAAGCIQNAGYTLEIPGGTGELVGGTAGVGLAIHDATTRAADIALCSAATFAGTVDGSEQTGATELANVTACAVTAAGTGDFISSAVPVTDEVLELVFNVAVNDGNGNTVTAADTYTDTWTLNLTAS